MSISGLHFAHLPMPIETLPRLSEIVGGSSLFIKRATKPDSLGGIKTIDLALRPGAQSDLRDST
jgi:1-aminocyclopropane-1-carboxylate deaminase/D-cysteine desulfhydrase-like pyridoxal-dependent ACC family enzyme